MRAPKLRLALASLSLPWSLALAGCASEPAAPGAEPAAAESPAVEVRSQPAIDLRAVLSDLHLGLDVSYHSGAIDWHRVAAEGHSWAVVKATEGVDNPDRSFPQHWLALKEAGLVRGAYHFYVTEDDPEEQARFFLDTVDFAPGDLAPVVDLELIGRGTRPDLVDRVKRYLQVVEREVGVKPIIYTSPNFWDQHMSDEFGEYPLWVAEYGVEEPRLPAGWGEWHLWQWQEDAEVPGVESGADLSHVNRSASDLSVLLIPAARAE